MKTRARATIDHLPAYSFPDLELPGVDRVVVLAQNELALPPGDKAIRAAQAALADMNRYSDIDQRRLREAIARVHNLNLDKLVCGAGSLELMSLIASAYCEDGTEVVVSQYGYKFFQVLCSVAGASIRIVAEPEMRIDIEAVAAAVNDRTRIVFLVNPGNPTGSLLQANAVRELRKLLPPSVMLILDCAYAEFVEDPAFESGFDLVDEGENVVVLRTFSKAYGLAGMRVGWAYAAADVVDSILKIRSPNSISSPSLAAAEAAVQDREYLNRVCSEISELRRDFIELANSLKLTTLPSSANFVLIGCPGGEPVSASELDSELRKNGVIVRPMGSYGLSEHLRVSIGSREEMAIIGSVMTQVLGS